MSSVTVMTPRTTPSDRLSEVARKAAKLSLRSRGNFCSAGTAWVYSREPGPMPKEFPALYVRHCIELTGKTAAKALYEDFDECRPTANIDDYDGEL